MKYTTKKQVKQEQENARRRIKIDISWHDMVIASCFVVLFWVIASCFSLL